jgi:hypothetical protein
MKNDPFRIDFCGLGAPKAGSTWTAEMLDAHPALCMSQPKEVAYFNACHPFHGANPNFGRPTSWYRGHFRHCRAGVRLGEFTTAYLWDAAAPHALKEHNPAVRLVACLRDPVSCAYSLYWMRRQYLREEQQPTFERAIEADEAYLSLGLYAEQLARYFELFGQAQVHVVLFDDIVNTPLRVVRDLYRFLGVDEAYVPADIRRPRKVARRVRAGWAVGLMRATNRALVNSGMSRLARVTKRLGLKELFMHLTTAPAEYPPLHPDTRRCLARHFADDISRLEQMLARDLSRWKRSE